MTETLQVTSQRLDPGALQSMTRELAGAINRSTDVSADLPEGETAPGHRGDAVTLGTIALSFITSGAAVALFQVLKAYFERDESLVMEFERPDGRKMIIKAENMSAERIDSSVALAQTFFADGEGD